MLICGTGVSIYLKDASVFMATVMMCGGLMAVKTGAQTYERIKREE